MTLDHLRAFAIVPAPEGSQARREGHSPSFHPWHCTPVVNSHPKPQTQSQPISSCIGPVLSDLCLLAKSTAVSTDWASQLEFCLAGHRSLLPCPNSSPAIDAHPSAFPQQEGPSFTYATCSPPTSGGSPLRLISLWPQASAACLPASPGSPQRTPGLSDHLRGLQRSLQPSPLASISWFKLSWPHGYYMGLPEAWDGPEPVRWETE